MDESVNRREYESDKESIWKEIGRLGGIIEGPPHPGLGRRVDSFMISFEALETEREKQHKANTRRLDLIIGIMTLVALYVPIYLSFHHN